MSDTERPTPPLKYGGVELTLYALASDLRARGWDVHLWGAFQKNRPELYEGMTCHDGRDPDGTEVLLLNLSTVYVAWPTVRQVRILTRERRRVVIGEYNHPTCLPPMGWDLYVRCMNPLFAEQAARHGVPKNRVFVIPYWVRDETRYRPDLRRENWLLWVGRPDAGKALEEMFRFASRTGEEVRFVAPGYPGDQEWVRVLDRVRPGNVRYLGEMSRKERQGLYSRCRALLYTARAEYREAFGLVFLEAMGSGTRVVALDHREGSTQSTLFPGLPFGVRASDTDTLARLWLEQRDKLEPAAVRARYEEMFSGGSIRRRDGSNSPAPRPRATGSLLRKDGSARRGEADPSRTCTK